MLIKATLTGQSTKGETVERTITVEGVKLKVTELDTWSSGEHAGDGRYVRCTFIEPVAPIDPWPNIKPRKESQSHD